MRQILARASYVQAVCWVGACLADGLQYAHERGLVHLDLKPSNVLLAADGQPLLLDFHLARAPLAAGKLGPEWFGGTPDYMSPEQRAALEAVRQGRPVPAAVDARSDLFSLGWVLYETLGGRPPDRDDPTPPPRLDRCNPEVSPGLADLVHKCLEPDPGRRYASAADLAADLRRHINNQPLEGVPNRSLRERWQKWRRRRPHALRATVLLLALAGVAAGAGGGAWLVNREYAADARNALRRGPQLRESGQYGAALDVLTSGLDRARRMWLGGADLAGQLERELRRTRRAWGAHELHDLVQRLGFLSAADVLPGEARELEARGHALWERRGLLLDAEDADLGPAAEEGLRADLLDLAPLWAGLHVRLADPSGRKEARQLALRVLDEAEKDFGPSPVLGYERRAQDAALHGQAPGPARFPAGREPRTAWEHYALGRSLLQAGDRSGAAAAFRAARARDPGNFWATFYEGVCAYRGQEYGDAIRAFSECIGKAPDSGPCYYNRALAEKAAKEPDHALEDYDRALELSPRMAEALHNRGLLHFQGGRYGKAIRDLENAVRLGMVTAPVYYSLALAQYKADRYDAARKSIERAFALDPRDEKVRELREQLRKGPVRTSPSRHPGPS